MLLPLSHTRHITAAPIHTYISSPCLHVHARQTTSPTVKIVIVRTRIWDSMGQGAAKAKQGGEEAAQKTPEKKDTKKTHKSSDANALIEFMRKNYDAKVKDVTDFDEFYHAIYELIENFCEERGQLQYRIPPKNDLKQKYEKFHKGRGTNVTADEFEKIAKEILKIDSFTFGKAAIDILVVLFGVPVCALLAKRVVPGLKSVSDDIVIPAATSGAVVYLAKSNKL